MICKDCSKELPPEQGGELCEACEAYRSARAKRSKNFWGEVEKTQTTIEEFGYRVKTEIRKSENTVIYIAANEENETVAIKRITVPCEDVHSEVSERIRAEMEALSRISSGNGDRFVITYYDYKLVETCDKLKYDLYIRMDYLTSLAELYAASKLKIADLLHMATDICDALEWCHSNGRIHNDLNLNNIFKNEEGRYVLGDFAFSDHRCNETAHCIAPELFRGETADSSSDIYALGMVMYMLLNGGLPPFAASGSEQDLQRALIRLKNGEQPTPAAQTGRLNELVCSLLAPKDKRCTSVVDLKKQLSFLLSSMPSEYLEQCVNDVHGEEPPAIKRTVEKTPVHTEEAQLPVKKSPVLSPEQAELKSKNRRDFWLIGTVVVLLVGVITLGTVMLYQSGNRAIYDLIETESYAVAYKEISQLHGAGQNVDELVLAYIDACMTDREYKRVVQAVPLLSSEAMTDEVYLRELLSDMLTAKKTAQARALAECLAEYEHLQSMLEEFKEDLQ